MTTSPAAKSFMLIAFTVLVTAVGLGIGLHFIVNTNDKSDEIKTLSEQVVRTGDRIVDCTDPAGTCYKQTQAQTAKAVQTILDYMSALMGPHRLRNEAENLCSVLVAAEIATDTVGGKPPLDATVYADSYEKCVLGRSGNTPPPPVPTAPSPQNSPTTTTTGRKGR